MFCIKFHAVTKRSQMYPNTMKRTETLVWGPMGWIGCVRCRKSRRHFVARTFALIAPVHPVLHRVSCSYKTIPNAPKHYETHQNMSLGSNGGGSGAFITKKLQCDFVVRSFVLIDPVQYVVQQVSSSYGTNLNETKYYKMHRNNSFGSNGVDWVCSLWKIPRWLHGTNFCVNCTSSPHFAPSFKQLRNNPKCTQIVQMMEAAGIFSRSFDESGG